MPVAPEELPGGRAGVNPRELLVLRRGQHEPSSSGAPSRRVYLTDWCEGGGSVLGGRLWPPAGREPLPPERLEQMVEPVQRSSWLRAPTVSSATGYPRCWNTFDPAL